eukprot:1081704-Prorocentrum_minimum.AAC.1
MSLALEFEEPFVDPLNPEYSVGEGGIPMLEGAPMPPPSPSPKRRMGGRRWGDRHTPSRPPPDLRTGLGLVQGT